MASSHGAPDQPLSEAQHKVRVLPAALRVGWCTAALADSPCVPVQALAAQVARDLEGTSLFMVGMMGR